MAEPTRTVLFLFRRPLRRQERERKELMDSISQTRVQLGQAYGSFNTTSDHDLIESYVYEINSLHARYNYLLRQMKQMDQV